MKQNIWPFKISNLTRVAALPRQYLDEFKSRKFYETLSDIPKRFGQANSSLCDKLLLDGHFLNPGYFYRLQLFRAALGSSFGDEMGFIWRHNTGQCDRILKTLGVRKTHYYFPNPDESLRKDARRLAELVHCAEDLLMLTFPQQVPASFLYDDILKRQRAPTVNVFDPMVEKYIWEFLSSIRAAEDLLDNYRPDIVAMSHSISIQCAPLSWLASKRGIPVVTLFGNYGLPRFWRMYEPEDIYYGMDRPERLDMDGLTIDKSNALAEIGRTYLTERFSGQTNDLGGRMAFQGDNGLRSLRNSLDGRPVVAVYASNWFDFPHALGMNRFTDFLDWITATLNVALETPSVRWLFRAHPCDKWYGGMTLKDVMPPNLPEHINLLPDDCSGRTIMELADALVTYHGTAGIEYASQGKPVMVADRGWYQDCGFVVFPESREHYLSLLRENWFDQVETSFTSRRAEIFAGWYFCNPDWQSHATLPDDADRELIKAGMESFLEVHGDCIQLEVALLRRWLSVRDLGYHTFKMANSDRYALSNVI